MSGITEILILSVNVISILIVLAIRLTKSANMLFEVDCLLSCGDIFLPVELSRLKIKSISSGSPLV